MLIPTSQRSSTRKKPEQVVAGECPEGIEAEKAAAANVILRRKDAAATRNMANTAKVIAENPVLMRLKELETMKDIADQIDELKLVVGLDGLKGFLPLAGGKDN